MPERKRDTTKVLKPSTLGSRLQELRTEAEMTQLDLANELTHARRAMGLPDVKKGSRSAIAQYERDSSAPTLDTIQIMAKIFKTTPEFIAFGTNPGGDGEAGMPFMVNEYAFGGTPSERVLIDRWGYPKTWLEQEVNAHRPEDLIVYKVQYPQVEGYEHNDRVLVDTGSTKITPPGNFLHWDGVGPTISHISVAHGAPSKKVMARVKTKEDTYEIEADKLQIIGRVLVAVKGR